MDKNSRDPVHCGLALGESLTLKGKQWIAPIYRHHAAEIRKVFADASLQRVASF
jgi:hypothetical protein